MLTPTSTTPTPVILPSTTKSNGKKNILLAGIVILAILAIAIPLIISNRDSQQEPVTPVQSTPTHAWATDQSATAACSDNGAKINISFTNTEPDFARFCMKVTATDQQTKETVSLGEINPGETKTAQINTNRTTISSGQVKFDLLWCDGHDGNAKDSRTANYSNITCESAPISQCRQIKLYNAAGTAITTDNIYIDDTITVAVTYNNTGAAPTKARFSFDNGATWQESTTKNTASEFTTSYKVPAKADINIKAQIFTATGVWN